MRPRSRTIVASAVLVSLFLPAAPLSATCGGGGGGGMGGATPGGGGGGKAAEVYHVPWKIVGAADPIPSGDLSVYWFPTSADEAKKSTLLGSRGLTLASARCVAMALITPDNAAPRGKYGVDGSAVVLVGRDGAELGRVTPQGSTFDSDVAENLLSTELDKRETAAKALLDAAKEKQEAKDEDGAAALYTQVWEQRCLFPDLAKKASKGLKKLGKPVQDASLWDGGMPNLEKKTSQRIVGLMNAGMAAERDENPVEANKFYEAARKLDPADPVPVRFLGELMRHHIGDWVAARALFEQVLAMPSDPVSRAVALHGLGKMTIHEGRYDEGLTLFKLSLDAYPLALTYRNLAVYWNSERDHVQAHAYVDKALALDPEDPYNLIFAATYYVELGRPDEARAVAKQYESVLAASYNLAAIHAQLGDKQQALAMLERHFHEYEKFDAVRSKEMREARDDQSLASLHGDPEFIALTDRADPEPANPMKRTGS
ncbi:MAG TPA: tetratricopeptide repeat protein [Candidatus Polarisedimenticolaceae bacterium]|nr:tetratricopeptide repeat protein [Candidatus Polarisedimenticolaceae bacterium]